MVENSYRRAAFSSQLKSRVGHILICSFTADFLEQHGTRLEVIKPKGPKAQRTSEGASRGGSTRRKGWYRTNDI
jgi:hypothetical protein